MLSPRTLRGRLTSAYASALILALVSFSGLTLVILNGAQHDALDTQSATIARGIAAVVDDRRGHVALDADDIAQLRSIVGAKASSAVFGLDGGLAAATGAPVSDSVRAAVLKSKSDTLLTEHDGHDPVRVFATPILRKEGRIGSVAVWRDAGDAEALDRRVGSVLALAIPLIAAVAIALGSEIARRGLKDVDRIATLASEIEANDLDRRLGLPQRGDEWVDSPLRSTACSIACREPSPASGASRATPRTNCARRYR